MSELKDLQIRNELLVETLERQGKINTRERQLSTLAISMLIDANIISEEVEKDNAASNENLVFAYRRYLEKLVKEITATPHTYNEDENAIGESLPSLDG